MPFPPAPPPADSADIPTAPEWAMILLGALLILQLARHQPGPQRGDTATLRSGTLRSAPEVLLLAALLMLLLLTNSAHADEALQYDERGNVQTRTVDGRTSTYRYDPLDRLKSETGKASQSFGLDANGNRTADANATYTVLANGNRLITRNGITLSYDPAGNLLSDQAKINGVTVTRSFGYGPAGTLKTVAINGTPTASYIYDGRWMRMRKTLANPPPGTPAITLYRYDPYGKISEEIAGSGANAGQTLVTYIWKDDIPSAIIYAPGTPSNTGTIERIVYLHPDHLNTPRKASDSQGRIVWSWESDAFGSTAPNEDVDGDGQKTVINLRLPGQYFDAESGLHYNWHRYFDPQAGRYTQPDPIGLAGGINPYAYALNRPTSVIDPDGLDPWGSTMCLPTHVYVTQSSGNGKDGPIWGAAGTAANESPESPAFMSFPANSFPDKDNGSPGIVDGTYYGTYGSKAHGYHPGGVRTVGPGVRLNSDGRVSTLGPNPAQGGMPFSTYVHLHCQNYQQSRSDTNRGSEGCVTVRGDYCQKLWDLVKNQCNKNVVIHVIRN